MPLTSEAMHMKLSGCATGVAIAFAGAMVCVPSFASAVSTGTATAGPASECAGAYPGSKSAACVRVACNAKYQAFLGTWSGEFHAYVRKQSSPGHAVFRPYDQSIAYSADDCLRNTGNGDVFIVGHVTNRYAAFGKLPAKTERNLLITGRHADGTPFLRTVRSEGTYDYKLAFQDQAASLSIWRLRLPAAHGQPPMAFTIVDGRDFNASSRQRRDVTITMQVGPDKTPYWRGVIAYGWHARQG
jgi:hypothetical protein